MAGQITVGGVAIGAGAPVSVQSMCNTKTEDIPATVAQIKRLAEAGCQIVRLAVPSAEAAAALGAIREQSPVPLVADIHFDYRLALTAAEAGIDKIRINPGNIGSEENVRKVALSCRSRNIPIRIGINGGSLEKPLLAKYGGPTPEAMLESARNHAALLNRCDFDDICVSLKCSDVPATVAAYRLAHECLDYPLHIGVTESGGGDTGMIRSAVGIGALLLDGIGDTLRVSLTGDPVKEVETGLEILRAVGLRHDGPEIIACPTCGRTEIDLAALYDEVCRRLKGCRKSIRVAVMGCVVNGPGEASSADYGIAGGRGYGMLFKKGQMIKKVPAQDMARELMAMMESDLGPL
ncbi:MAG: flavodoxin-dependent (E)-4-hydroxy-3-methylbut-2-enyl-diphosphate synthase [Oscillospiraceae bacterium]|jgi:(E)-4-hydroxy-3-methylbut-2-enyl-diphosphate synthase|nr:flavodoxin-dependent (E)-4-hydroxy-3-methylbut-2-enyl-diphosphate synthase [Oscillospiraceae bacterium]